MKDIYNNTVDIDDIILITCKDSLVESIIENITNDYIETTINNNKLRLQRGQFILKQQPRYFISAFKEIEEKNNLLSFKDLHCFGYFEIYDEAIEALNNDWCSIQENGYQYAIVEKIFPGINEISNKRTFLMLDKSKKGYFEIQEPQEFQKYYNFAIG